MAGTIIDQYILQSLISKFMPELSNFFDEMGFDLAPITLQWFISIFAQNLTYEVNKIYYKVRTSYMGCFIPRRKHYNI